MREQCEKCPWKTTTNPYDIPNGYCVSKHRALKRTIADAEVVASVLLRGPLHVMTCHETERDPCVGWLVNQLGPGNNVALRMRVHTGKINADVRTVGPQHERFEDTLPTERRPSDE